MVCLPDVNVWIALVVEAHAHHSVAVRWEQQLEAEELALCRVTEMSLLRLLTNAQVMNGYPLTAGEAWNIRDQVLSDPRTSMIAEPAHFDARWRRTSSAGKVGPNFWTDAYLAALCATANCTLVTFDRALAAKKSCSVHLLATPVQ